MPKAKGIRSLSLRAMIRARRTLVRIINKINAASPDAILGGGHFADGTTFAKTLYEKQVPAKFIALLVAPPEPTFKDIGDASQYIIGPSQWETQATYSADVAKAANLPYYGPSVKEFTDAYVANTRRLPPTTPPADTRRLDSSESHRGCRQRRPSQSDRGARQDEYHDLLRRREIQHRCKTHGKQTTHDMVYMQWQKDAAGKLVTNIVWPLDAKSADAQFKK